MVPDGLFQFAFRELWCQPTPALNGGLATKIPLEVSQLESFFGYQMVYLCSRDPLSPIPGIEQPQHKITFIFAHHILAFSPQSDVERVRATQILADREVRAIR